jgi:hypothetical protein
VNNLIDRLKEGLADAQKRQAEVQKRFVAMQSEFQTVTAEVNGYQKVLELETRKELERAASIPFPEPSASDAIDSSDLKTSKTQLVKDTLAEHPGLTPAQLWGALKNEVGRRNYVYSVLKRLKDRKQVVEKRGKYYLPATPKIEEVHEQTNSLQ